MRPAGEIPTGRFRGRGGMIVIGDNIARFEGSLRQHQSQVPFAIASGINDTLNDVKLEEERRLPVIFDRPTPFTRKGLMIRRASKARLAGELRYKDIQQKYLRLQQTGGVRTPKGRALVVPVGLRLNQFGNLPRGAIKRLLARRDVFSGEVKGVAGIWQRPKARGGKLKLLIAYEPSAKYQPRMDFGRHAYQVASRVLQQNLARAWRRAIQTAR